MASHINVSGGRAPVDSIKTTTKEEKQELHLQYINVTALCTET